MKVLDVTGELGPYTGKMHAGLGADVIYAEPITGSPLRRIGPFYKNKPGLEASLQHLYFNAGKRGLAIDISHEQGRQIFCELCDGADLLIESFTPGYLDGLGLSYEVLSKRNPKLIQTSITPFGSSGPLAKSIGSDLTCAAQSGFLHLAGTGNNKPVRAPDDQSYRMAEVYAAAASAAALFGARRTGQGQFVDVACVEACAMALESSPQHWDLEGTIRRGRGQEAANGSIHPCADGFIVLVAIVGNSKASWDAFVNWMRNEDVEGAMEYSSDKWLESSYRSSKDGYAAFCRIFEPYAATRPKLYLYETGQRYNVAISPVSNGRDLMENPHLSHRGFWQHIQNEALGGNVVYPGAPYEFGELQWRFGRNAPRLGEHTSEILRELGHSALEIDAFSKSGAMYAEKR